MKSISSRDNPLIKKLRALASSARERRKHGQTVLDGEHLLRAALDAGQTPEAVLVSPAAIEHPEIAETVATAEVTCPVYLVPDALLAQCSPVATTTGVLAVFSPPSATDLPIHGDAILLEQVQDAGNLGTLMRTATAAGIRHVLMTAGCAQAWSPKVLRAAMGAHFVCEIHEGVDPFSWFGTYAGNIYATALGSGSASIYASNLIPPGVWLFGAEGAGLSEALMARATHRLVIPMPGQVESLNVAAAAAVCLFEQSRQRQA